MLLHQRQETLEEGKFFLDQLGVSILGYYRTVGRFPYVGCPHSAYERTHKTLAGRACAVHA